MVARLFDALVGIVTGADLQKAIQEIATLRVGPDEESRPVLVVIPG
jgi:hypothetical protein